MNQPLIFALARGRLLDETVPLLTELGIEPTESLTGSRKLMFETEHPGVKLLVLRAADVPPYVERVVRIWVLLARMFCWSMVLICCVNRLIYSCLSVD